MTTASVCCVRWFVLLIAGIVGLVAPGQVAYAQTAPPSSANSSPALLHPHPWQFDLQAGCLFGFTGPGSIVRVREFQTEGTGLHLSYLGINTEQMPTGDITLWFTELSALHFRLRYFNLGGTRFLRHPVLYNGATLAPGQTLHTNPSEWFSVGLYYERRLSPWFERYENGWPIWLQHWDVRGRLGIEYTYLSFDINSGHAKVTSTSKGEESTEDFYHQSMPLPTVGVNALHRVGDDLLFDFSVQGNWINRWNSLRNEGGTIWASQNGVEAHARIFYSNRQYLGPVQPMIGMFIYYYSQLEDSHEDGNFLRWSSWGPELGINCSF